jgi:hypothetical protein
MIFPFVKRVNPVHTNHQTPERPSVYTSTRSQRPLPLAILIAIAAVALVLAGSRPAPLPAATGLRAAPGAALYPAISDRFGVGVNRLYGGPEDYDVAQLAAGWYVDWGTQLEPAYPAGLDYLHIVRVSGDTFTPDLDTLSAVARANPGATWIIGNEPDSPWQDNSTPDQYARVYRQLYTFLKDLDPTSRVTIGGIVQATPLRLLWLDAVLDIYLVRYGEPFPVDLWNIHTFILQEKSCAVYPFDCWGAEIPPGIPAHQGVTVGWGLDDHDDLDRIVEQLLRFRGWMRDRGQRHKELIVSEYGILMPDSFGYDAPRVQAFMIGTFDYFMTATDPALGHPDDGNRLVQRWAWYSLNDKRFEGHMSHSHLYDPSSKTLTPLGIAFRDYVNPLYGSYVDLLPAAILTSPPSPLLSGGEPITITLTAMVRNAGNTDVGDASVRFWVGDPGQPIGSVQVIPNLPARALDSATVEWSIDAPGVYTLGVTADAEHLIVESDEGNNQASTNLLVAGHVLHRPLVSRAR